MFDLDYYNEITDYGKLSNELVERRRTIYKNPAVNNNKTNLQRDIWLNQINNFNRKHIGYSAWFNNNKVIKKTYTDEYLNNIKSQMDDDRLQGLN